MANVLKGKAENSARKTKILKGFLKKNFINTFLKEINVAPHNINNHFC